MTDPIFFKRPQGLTVAEIAAMTGATLSDPARQNRVITGVAPLQLNATARPEICGNRPVPPAKSGWQNGVNPLTNAARRSLPVSVKITVRLPKGSTANSAVHQTSR